MSARQSVERPAGPIRKGFIDVDGKTMHYVQRGSGPALLLLHAAPCSARVMEPLQAAWGTHFSTFAFDLPGFGLSDAPAGDPINLSDPPGNAPWGWIAGAVAAAVTGVLIGALTFGVGGVAVVGYGYGALAAQIGFGLVSGAIEGAAAEVVTQLVDGTSWSGVNWASVGIAAGVGAGVGALTAGTSAAYFKFRRPKANLIAQERKLGADYYKAASSTDAYGVTKTFAAETAGSVNMMQVYKNEWKRWVATAKANGVDPGSRLQNMFSRKSWNRRLAAIQRQETTGGGNLLGLLDDAGSSASGSVRGGGKSFKSISSEAQDLGENALRMSQQAKITTSLDLADDQAFQNFLNFNQGAQVRRADDVYGKIAKEQRATYSRTKTLSKEVSELSSGEVVWTPPKGQEEYNNYIKSLFK
jgi:pimeloyl-ACP methyl ester carboxylesterase